MNKFDALTRSQILLALHNAELQLSRVPRNSKAYTRLHTQSAQLITALQRKTDALMTKWRESPII